jgi:hypothetical protein
MGWNPQKNAKSPANFFVGLLHSREPFLTGSPPITPSNLGLNNPKSNREFWGCEEDHKRTGSRLSAIVAIGPTQRAPPTVSILKRGQALYN